MNKFKLFLRSKIRGGGYDNLAGSIELAEFWLYKNNDFKLYSKRKTQSASLTKNPIFILTSSKNEILFAIIGTVATYLGKDNPLSWDRPKEHQDSGGRIKPFVLGYSITKEINSTLPNYDSLNNLENIIKIDTDNTFDDIL